MTWPHRQSGHTSHHHWCLPWPHRKNDYAGHHHCWPLPLSPLLWTNWEVSVFGEIPGKVLRKELNHIKKKVFPMLRIWNIPLLWVRTLYNATLDSFKLKAVSEGINGLAKINIIPIVVTTSLVIYILSVRMCQLWKFDW